MLKRLSLSFLILISGCTALAPKVFATSLTIPYQSKNTGDTIFASQWNSNFQAISTWANNNNIDGNTNIATGGVSTAAIANLAVTDAKISGISTAGKVNGSAITGLANLPSGAGLIPTANLGSGATSATFLRGDQTYASVWPPYVKCTNTQSSGVAGGTATLGAWTTITLNTKDSDTGSIATLSSNQITLPAGTYYVRAVEPFYGTSQSQIRLFNITDSSLILLGGVTYAVAAPNTIATSTLNGTFTIAGSKVVAFQYQTTGTQATNGLGLNAGFGSEVYAQIEFLKTS